MLRSENMKFGNYEEDAFDSIYYRFVSNVKIGQLLYRVSISHGYEVYFQILSGTLKNGKRFQSHDSFGGLNSSIDVIGNVRDPVKVIRTVVRIVKEWLHLNSPPYIIFRAYEKSRQRLYKRLAKELERSEKYQVVYDEKGYYMLVNIKRLRVG